jgi:hypothetical protein
VCVPGGVLVWVLTGGFGSGGPWRLCPVAFGQASRYGL